ncbi:MAG: hypothetical protein L0Y79_08050 [Chlorobi bacterium]|nr:hypothetical protein [Chlorobiota bacterium]MCI0715363.1 hypothetical protein [Chlorobiota bacterium]
MEVLFDIRKDISRKPSMKNLWKKWIKTVMFRVFNFKIQPVQAFKAFELYIEVMWKLY